MPLVLGRQIDDVILLHTTDGVIRVWVTDTHLVEEWSPLHRFRLAIDAPRKVKILREELKHHDD